MLMPQHGNQDYRAGRIERAKILSQVRHRLQEGVPPTARSQHLKNYEQALQIGGSQHMKQMPPVVNMCFK